MARIARVVIPGCPHHLTQRGNRRLRVFFCDDDKSLYLTLLKRQVKKLGKDISGRAGSYPIRSMTAIFTRQSGTSKGILSERA